MINKIYEEYLLSNSTPRQFLERRLVTLFGINSMAIRALDLVCTEMCIEKGFKRDDGQDYYNHCIDVANTLISFGIKNEDAICAALLHDIIEDVTGYTYECISNMFNKHVADLVLVLTKKKGVDYKEDENIKEYLENIAEDIFASAIKTADRMHNMMTLQEKTFEARYRKALETEKYYLPFFKYCRKKYTRYENLFYAARVQIHPLIFEIKSFYGEIIRLQNQIDEFNKSKSEITN